MFRYNDKFGNDRFHQRFFVLTKFALTYFSGTKANHHTRQSYAPLKAVTSITTSPGPDAKHPLIIHIVYELSNSSETKSISFSCPTLAECQEWIGAIEKAVEEIQ
eukprot:Awhi_evm1s3480